MSKKDVKTFFTVVKFLFQVLGNVQVGERVIKLERKGVVCCGVRKEEKGSERKKGKVLQHAEWPKNMMEHSLLTYSFLLIFLHTSNMNM